ncbi:hypothetical protein [Acetobacter oeni]|uniref:Uncharacterized protein n=1 Tax=Acetobacter oeni TaxID=304077 RepID=A0A511XJU2_9PROT|nr:hypothetical protein [Acetobacter oeni]MBB3883439.1 hypothetical protein [Acetobacter oeni]NHO19411.1 hypothetical protein [Acetobacter oeni]GBR04024.1 hypothetical protein AA21952_1269 [Acetobacter oeni LMG 21952]GEN63220.1 hypothetical protein AOE01nite_14440 [Acetobacter oeni]
MSGVIMYLQLMAWQQHLGRDHTSSSGHDDSDRPVMRHLPASAKVIRIRPAAFAQVRKGAIASGPVRRLFGRLPGATPDDALT